MTIKLTSFLQCDDPDSLANNTKRPLNVNAPLFTPQSTMGNGGNILDQVRIVSNLCRYVFDILIKVRKFMIFDRSLVEAVQGIHTIILPD